MVGEEIVGKETVEDKNPVEKKGGTGRNDVQDADTSFRKIMNSAVLIILVVLVFIALFSFFFNMQDAIIALFHPRYQALIKAMFSFVILVVGLLLIRYFLSK